MALFKILRGPKSSLNSKPINDGYAYFIPENEGFYIDYAPEGSDEGRRIHINPRSFGYETVLLADGWLNGEQTITVPELTENSIGTIGLSQQVSSQEIQVASEADLYVKEQKAGQIIIGYRKTTPLINLPVYIIVSK